jgi:hypothetical protein
MTTIFALLAVAALAVGVVGLIRPSLVLPAAWKPGRLKAGLLYVAAFLVLAVVGQSLEDPTSREARLAAKAEREAAAAVEAEARRAEQQRVAAETEAATAKARAEREASNVAAKAEKARAEVMRAIEKANRSVEKVERFDGGVNVWLKPVNTLSDKDWLFMVSMTLGDIWRAARDAMPDAGIVRVIAQADFEDLSGKASRGIGMQIKTPMAVIAKVDFNTSGGPMLLEFAEIEKLRRSLHNEVAAFCGDRSFADQAPRFCRAASQRLLR